MGYSFSHWADAGLEISTQAADLFPGLGFRTLSS